MTDSAERYQQVITELCDYVSGQIDLHDQYEQAWKRANNVLERELRKSAKRQEGRK